MRKKNKILILVCLAFQLLNAQHKSDYPSRTIAIDVQKVKGKHSEVYKHCIGAGRANEGLRADWQEQLRLVKKECDFKYIRMHGILHDDMGVYTEDKLGNSIYNWQYIDALYDFLISIDIKPVVELTFMPKALASDTTTVFWWRGNISQPKSYHKWAELIKNLAIHLSERYGEEEVRTWYFEVWNEPNLSFFFMGTMNDYFKLYQTTALAIKEVNKDYRVGGPATAGANWIKETLDFCEKTKTPLDFIATHQYGCLSGFFDEKGDAGTILSKNPRMITEDVEKCRKYIDESSFGNLPLFFTEWSASWTPTDPIHDSYHEAAFIMDKLKATENIAQSMSYWVFTDIFEELGPRATPFHGGFGLLNYQGIKKPAYYAYRFLNQLGTTELVNEDKASWVCKDSLGGIQALFWNFTITHPNDSLNDQIYYKSTNTSKLKERLNLNFKNIKRGIYILEVYKVGFGINDAYSSYLTMGSPSQLTKLQVGKIISLNNGDAISTDTITIDHELNREFLIRENDVVLIKLRPIK